MSTPADARLARLMHSRTFRAFIESWAELHPKCEPEMEIETEEDNRLTIVLRIPAEVFE